MKLTSAERTGLMAIGVIIIAASIAIAIFSHWERRLPISENTVPPAVDSLISDVEATDTVVKSRKHKQQRHAPAPKRNPLDETF